MLNQFINNKLKFLNYEKDFEYHIATCNFRFCYYVFLRLCCNFKG